MGGMVFHPDSPGFAGVWPVVSSRLPVASCLAPDPWSLTPTCEVARSSAACPRRWVPGGSGLSLVSESGLVLPVLFPVLPGQVLAKALAVARPGVSAGWAPLLSKSESSTREPAQHKDGFPSESEGNPVERVLSGTRPGIARRGESQIRSQALQRGTWGQEAPGATRGFGDGKVR